MKTVALSLWCDNGLFSAKDIELNDWIYLQKINSKVFKFTGKMWNVLNRKKNHLSEFSDFIFRVCHFCTKNCQFLVQKIGVNSFIRTTMFTNCCSCDISSSNESSINSECETFLVYVNKYFQKSAIIDTKND